MLLSLLIDLWKDGGPIHAESLIQPSENTWLCSAKVFDSALGKIM